MNTCNISTEETKNYLREQEEDKELLREYIKTLPESIKSKLSHTENYPFFQFYGHNMVIYYKNFPLYII